MRPLSSFVGQPIRSLQTMLRVIAEDDPSHLRIVPDGIYGPETTAAVSTFQRNHGLPVTVSPIMRPGKPLLGYTLPPSCGSTPPTRWISL